MWRIRLGCRRTNGADMTVSSEEKLPLRITKYLELADFDGQTVMPGKSRMGNPIKLLQV
jgi:hypothetical protein